MANWWDSAPVVEKPANWWDAAPLAQEAEQPPEQGQPNMLMDVLASGASGVARGAADLAGLPGTIGDALDAGGEWVMRQLGLPTRGEAMQERGLDPGSPLSGQSFREGLSTITGGATDYQPQTMPGAYARTAGEFLPGAAAFGGGSMANLARFGLAPAVASETAGQATEGTAVEPYARVAGALVGGYAGSRVGAPAAQKMPTAAEIKASADYAGLKGPMQAVRLQNDSYRGIVGQLRQVADDFGMVPEQHRAFQSILQRHANQAKSGTPSLQDLEILRRSLQNAGKSTTDASARALSARLVETLDDAVAAMPGGALQVRPGQSVDDTLEALRHARETWRTGSKASVVETAMERAQNAASGYENGLRTEFRKILNNQKLARQFTQAEREAMQQVVKGNFTSNALRWLGSFGVPTDQGRNFLGSMIGGGVGASIGSAVGGPIGAAVGGVGLPAIGTAAKAAANAATRNQATIAEALVKAGPAAGRIFSEAMQANQVAGREAILRALLQSQSAARVPSSRELAR